MSEYLKNLTIDTDSIAPKSQIYICNDIRFTVLTDKLLRVEIQEKGFFCDDPTQAVINRNFCTPEYSISEKGELIIICTSKVRYVFNKVSRSMESVTLSDGRTVRDFIKGNLKGTKRTLDNINGKTSLGNGIISTNGVAVLDDSASLLICNDGHVIPRKEASSDCYYFAYGFEYRNAIKDYFCLTGFPPLIPRFTLGNWWSRYKAYTQTEYTELMERFSEKKIPITVATIDMDWHWVDVVGRFGKKAFDEGRKNNLLEVFYNTILPGWTGYSWNTDLFPDPEGFLNKLKAMNLKITMNLHPASGCKFYETAYEDFCNFLGIDSTEKKQIHFDITDERFIEGYFRFLHHPHENSGVDFWWIDWQQGKNSAIKGLDPLWALNHYHSIDLTRDGKRPLILSRFAGAGSHRYPLGFSGDTVQTWESLDFQPYFTSTASNIGYSWWSHDIGGHCRGYRDDELYLRWLQFGVFSPIMRLHSTANEFMGKEPWMYNKFVEINAIVFMKLRHKLIPYIYSMNRRTASEGKCLIEPMYYENPKDPRAYNCPNEYYFGSELIVCPITKPCNKKTGFAETKVYLPKGRYTDIFTKRIYRGNTEFSAFRDQSSIPVFAKEGAIVPMYEDSDTNRTSNPENLEILISRGNNSFVLYEDDGESLEYKNGVYCETEFTIKKDFKDVLFRINKPEGNIDVIPAERNYILDFIDIDYAEQIELTVNDERFDNFSVLKNNTLKLKITGISAKATVNLRLINISAAKNRPLKEIKTELIAKTQRNNDIKTAVYGSLLKSENNCFVQTLMKKMIAETDNLYY